VLTLPPRFTRSSTRSVTVTVELVLHSDQPERLVEELRAFVSEMRALPTVIDQPSTMDQAEVRICRLQRTVRRGEAPVDLTRREFDLLLYLAQHPRQVFTREQLLRNVWGSPFAGERTVDVHVTRLRRKTSLPVVDTVRGVGYRLGTGATVAVLAT
jgi:DNA-binding response OmpR family regulator